MVPIKLSDQARLQEIMRLYQISISTSEGDVLETRSFRGELLQVAEKDI